MARGLAAFLLLLLCEPSLPWDARPWATAIQSAEPGKAPFVALLFQDGEDSEIDALLGDSAFLRGVERCALLAAGRHLHPRPDGVKLCPVLETITCEAHAKNWFPAYQSLAEDGTLTTPQLVVFDQAGRILGRWKQSFEIGGETGVGARVASVAAAYREQQAKMALDESLALLEEEDWGPAWKALALLEDQWPETEPATVAKRERAALERRRDLVDVIRPLVRAREAHALWKKALVEERRLKLSRARTIWKQLARKYADTTWGAKAAKRLAERKR